MLGRRFACDTAAVRCNNLLGDGKPQSSAAAVGRTRRIQAIELLKDHFELCRRNRIALVDKAHAHAANFHDIVLTRGYVDLGLLLAQVADEFYPILNEQRKEAYGASCKSER